MDQFPKHLEKRVVVGVVAHLVQIIVLTAHAQALLSVGDAAVFGHGIPQEVILKGVHSGIDEHQCGIVFVHHGCGCHYFVAFFLKKLKEFSTYLLRSQHTVNISLSGMVMLFV